VNRHISLYEETTLILSSLDVFYRYCPELVTDESIRVQSPELLRLLPRVLQFHAILTTNTTTAADTTTSGEEMKRRTKEDVFIPIVSIWHSFSASLLGSTLLLQQSTTIPAVHNMLQYSNGNLDVIMESLGLLKNLSYYGEDHRHRIVDHPMNLISTLSCLTGVFEDKALERLSAVFRNLALSTEVRIKLAQRLDVLNAIIRMAACCCDDIHNNVVYTTTTTTTTTLSNPHHHQDDYCMTHPNYDAVARKNTLRNVLSTLTSLALDGQSTPWMVFHGDGVLIDQLKRFMVHSDDAIVRKRSIRVLKLLARPTSIPVLLQDDDLLKTLCHHAMADPNDAVRKEAVEAFLQLASLVPVPSTQQPPPPRRRTEQYQTVLDSFIQLVHNPEVSSESIARALQEQARYPENRTPMAQRKELIEGMATILLSKTVSPGAKECICTTLVDLSYEKGNHTAIATPSILYALVQLLSDRMLGGGCRSLENDENHHNNHNNDRNNNHNHPHGRMVGMTITPSMKESTVRTILNLAKTPSNRKIMASHTLLLQSLLRVAVAIPSSNDDRFKKEVKGTILQLANEL
jgi:hypothetical protein